MNKKIIKDIEKMGGKLIKSSNENTTIFIFKSAKIVLNAYFKLLKKYPGTDFYTRDCKLFVYGLI
jgi:hypothetical protein